MNGHLVYVLDSLGSILTQVILNSDHFVAMSNRGWIELNSWLVKDTEIKTISWERMIDYIKEAA